MTDTAQRPEGPIAQRMRDKLTKALAPLELEIEDESERHRGHGGYRDGGETHFRLRIVATAFTNMNRVERSRQVHAIVAEELAERVHALSLSLSAPGA